MQRSYDFSEGGPLSEMAIVDTFTKLIFGEEDYCSSELAIIQALRSADSNVALDNHRDMGVYLRVLGVREMIHLVSRVQELMTQPLQSMPGAAGQVLQKGMEAQILNRRAH